LAKAKPGLPAADAIRRLADDQARLAVRVTPGAREESLAIEGGRLLAKVRAKPQDGAANDAVRKLIARALGLAPSNLTLIRGTTAREKLFAITQ